MVVALKLRIVGPAEARNYGPLWALRHQCFGDEGPDEFDRFYQAVFVEDDSYAVTNALRLVAAARCWKIESGTQAADSYTAIKGQHNLDHYTDFRIKMADFGRLVTNQAHSESARGASLIILQLFENLRAGEFELLFGCSSSEGKLTENIRLMETLKNSVGPEKFLPKAGQGKFRVVPFLQLPKLPSQVRQRPKPGALGAYLLCGGWVGNHAVVDHVLKTVHVFTGMFRSDLKLETVDRLKRLSA